MKKLVTASITILKDAITGMGTHDHITAAAAIAFYTIFSLPGLLITIVMIAGIFLGQEAVTGELSNQIEGFMGASAAATIESIIANIELTGSSTKGTLIGLGTLIFSATTVFVTLQAALNATWEVTVSQDSGWIRYLIERVVSFGMIVSLGFIFVVSLLADTVLKLLMDKFNLFIGNSNTILIELGSFVLTGVIVIALFTMIFVVLPDVKLGWKKAWVGSLITSILFLVGKFMIGIYIKQSNFSATYESAGSTILILVWVYYSTIIILFGSEITRAIIAYRGIAVDPSHFAELDE